MSCDKCLHHTLSLAFVLLLFLGAAVAVPTSVLVQNSEVTSNINAANNEHNYMTKVKRSSANVNEMMSKDAINDDSSTSANKKSSPEVLPPAFNVPTTQQQHFQNAGKDSGDNNSNANVYGQSAGINSMPSNEDIINSAIAAGLTAAAVQAAAVASQRELEQQQPLKQQTQVVGDETQSVLQKRGISNPEYLYGAMGMGGPYASASGSSSGNNIYGGGEYNNAYLSNPMQVSSGAELETVPTGFWADEIDPSVIYTDIQDEDFLSGPRASSYHNKAYENLQSILNAEAYPVPQTLHTGRFYGANNGNKRSNRYGNNNNGFVSGSSNARFADIRLKRDTKLTPADMLALVALVEAGERARKDPETETSNGYMIPSNTAPPEGYSGIKPYYPFAAGAYDYPNNIDAIDNGGLLLEPNMIDYYGMTANVEAIPKYELQREQKYGATLPAANGYRYGIKRFMVSKKKQSMGNFLNEPVPKPSISYNANSEKFY